VHLATLVFSNTFPGGQIASISQPALAKAMAKRAGENQRAVVAKRIFGFNLSQLWPNRRLLNVPIRSYKEESVLRLIRLTFLLSTVAKDGEPLPLACLALWR